MIDLRFYSKPRPLNLAHILALTQGVTSETRVVEIDDVATLEQASACCLAYADQRKLQSVLETTRAGVVLVTPDLKDFVPEGCVAVVCAKPRRAFALVAKKLYPETIDPEIALTARIDPSAQIGEGCRIDDLTVIGPDVVIGSGCHIASHVVIEQGVQIGNNAKISSFVSIQKAIIGHDVVIQSGTHIGKCGFGFDMSAQGHLSVPQLGRVIIEDNVHIGANTTIDRGALGDTVIGAGSRIDNLVQIAHNVVVGKNCVLVAQVGIAGSTTLGNFVIAAGQVGIADHLSIGDGVRIAAQSGLMRDVAPGETIAGSPAVPVRDWHRQTLTLQKLIRGK